MAIRFHDEISDINHVYDLIHAIFERAIMDVRGNNFEEKMEAIRWIYGQEPDFMFYCKLIDVNPDEIRFKLKEEM